MSPMQLIKLWRKNVDAQKTERGAAAWTAGYVFKRCADELEAALAEVSSPARPQLRNEWRLDDRGLLDDVVVDSPETFRLERMGDDHVWGAVYLRDGSRIVFNLFAGTNGLSLTHELDTSPRKAEGAVSAAPLGGEMQETNDV